MGRKLTSNQEAYCLARARGRNQTEAYLEAYPRSSAWKRDVVWSKASHLEADGKVRARIEQLQERVAEKVTTTRSQVINGMARTFMSGVELATQGAGDRRKVSKAAADAVASIGRTLLEVLPEDDPGRLPTRTFDFATLLTRDFLEPHRRMVEDGRGDFWFPGGRGGIKSTVCGEEVVRHIEQNPTKHAVVMMKVKANLRDAAYAQVVWAIEKMGLTDEYDLPESTLRIRKRSTGQLILFRGCDNPQKLKSIKVPFGEIGVVWIEEADQFSGMAEIRMVLQSVTRGADDVIRLFSFNPPRSQMHWANREMDERRARGEPVYPSCYLSVPPEWLGQAFLDDAEHLRETDELAYRHEYLGEPVGNGTEVFDRVEFREVTDAEISAFDLPVVGQDFGWYPDPWAVTLSEWQAAGRTLVTYAEDGANKLTPPEQAERIKALLTWRDRPDDDAGRVHHLRVYSDDASPESIASQRDNGVDARAAGKGNMREASYHWLQSVHWVIDPRRCPRLAAEVRAMQYETNRDGEVLSSIPDGDDHWIDATRYAVMPMVRRARSAYRDARRTV